MSEEKKLDGMLSSLVDQVGQMDPDFGVDIEVTPRNAESASEAEAMVSEMGGTTQPIDPKRFLAHVPVGKVTAIAGQDAVQFLRLVRKHRQI